MGFFDNLGKTVENKTKDMARQATDTGLIKTILDLQQKIEDDEAYPGDEKTLEILKEEADRRGLYY